MTLESKIKDYLTSNVVKVDGNDFIIRYKNNYFYMSAYSVFSFLSVFEGEYVVRNAFWSYRLYLLTIFTKKVKLCMCAYLRAKIEFASKIADNQNLIKICSNLMNICRSVTEESFFRERGEGVKRSEKSIISSEYR